MFKYNLIITIFVCLIALGCVRYFQTHKSSVIRGDLVVDSIVPINDSGSWVYFQPKQFGKSYYNRHPYYNYDIHFKVGDTLMIECDTITKRWTTSMLQVRGYEGYKKIQAEMQSKVHLGTVVINGYEWSQ